MTNTIQSIWDKVDKRNWNQCWPWTGRARSSNGYGRLDVDGAEGVYAHRVAYIAANPDCGLQLKTGGARDRLVLHTCDNPICCNPRHLFVGSHEANMADKKAKGRSKIWSHSTESPRAKLTSEDVFFMRLQKKCGATKKALALLYEVSEATISGAIYGRHYTDVPWLT